MTDAGWACAACEGQNPAGMRFCGHCGTRAPEAAERDAAARSASLAQPAGTAPTDVADALRSFVAGPVADRLADSGGRIAEERRLVTALFADLSGFTPLAERLDAEELLEVIDPLVTALSDIVGRYGGYVEKFAGDALLALFGAPVAHEDDAARALRTALEMHAELPRLRGRLPPDAAGLTLHIGVNSGHGIARVIGSDVRMDYAVLGDAVILAQRLESAAPPGETYVGDSTKRLAGAAFELEALPPLPIKGKSEPVAAWRLVGARHADSRTAGEPFVGRESELRMVLDALGLHGGQPRPVAVVGEAGVGKSRLAQAVRERASAAGHLWLEARSLSYGAAIPYQPFVDLVRRWSGIALDAAAEDAAASLRSALVTAGADRFGGILARLLGLPGKDEIEHLEPDAFRRRLLEQLPQWLDTIGDDAYPAILAVEDAHWADASSLELVASVAGASRVRLYLTSRTPGPLEAALSGASAGSRLVLALEALGASDARQLIVAELGGPVHDDLVAMIGDRAGGNPFFIRQLVQALRERAAIELSNGLWMLVDGGPGANEIPTTIEGVLAARVDQLPTHAARTLQIGAVIGRRVRIRLLEAVSSRTVSDSLDVLLEAGLLDLAPAEPEATLQFHHALVQEVAYGRLIRRQRRELHGRVAEAAERLYGDRDDSIDLLARHLYLADAGVKAIDYLERAARRAAGLWAVDEAIAHLRQAREVADRHAPERVDALALAVADLLEHRGDYDEARREYAAVAERSALPHALAGLAAVARRQGAYGEVFSIAAAAERRFGPTPRVAEHHAAALLATGRIGDGIAVAEAALHASPAGTAPELELLVARGRMIQGALNEAVDACARAERAFSAEGRLRGVASAKRIAGDALRMLGRLEAAESELLEGIAIADRIGNGDERGQCLVNLGVVHADAGNPERAIESYRAALPEFERNRARAHLARTHANIADALYEIGDDAAALTEAALGISIATEIGHDATLADATDTVALVEARRGNRVEAAAAFETAAAIYERLGATRRAEECRAKAEALREPVPPRAPGSD